MRTRSKLPPRWIWKILIINLVARFTCQDSESVAGKSDAEEDGKSDEDDGKSDKERFAGGELRKKLALAKDASDSETDEALRYDDVTPLAEDQLGTVFSTIDANGDAKLSKEELSSFVRHHEVEAARKKVDVQKEMKRKDTSNDGQISLEEHLRDTKTMSSPHSDVDTRNEDETLYFKSADANNDGVLDSSELPALYLRTQGKALDLTVKNSIRDADRDKNGKLDLSEFTEARFTNVDDIINHGWTSPAATFSRTDRNQDGYVDEDELRLLESGQLRQDDLANNLLKAMDRNGDEEIDRKEFVESSGVRDTQLQDYLIAWAKKRPVVSGLKRVS